MPVRCAICEMTVVIVMVESRSEDKSRCRLNIFNQWSLISGLEFIATLVSIVILGYSIT